MLNKKLLFVSLIFFLIQLIPANSNFAIPESSFVPLNSREITEFELTKSKSELYYSFENNYSDSDILINLQIAKGFTTMGFIYDSYDKIQTDTQGEYINYLIEFSLTEKTVLLKSSEYSIQKKKYYIIIKDILNSYNKDYISIFNEQDPILLQNERFITIEKFYSKNKFSFYFSTKKNEMAILDLNIDNENFFQLISIYKGSTNDLIYQGEKNKGEIKLNEDFESEENYIVEIESLEDPYLDVKSSIILHLQETNVHLLQSNTPLVQAFTGNKVFNFYVDIDDYDFEDENIIAFKFSDQVYNRKLLSHCYAKAMNFESNDDNKFLSNMPANEDDNEAIFQRLSGVTNLYHLYFKKSVKKEENKKTYLLIHLSLQIEEHDESSYISPDEFTVYLSEKPEKIYLDDYRDKNDILNINLKLENYIPKIYKLVLPNQEENLNKLSYIFYSSDSIQFAYNNTMLNSESHEYEKPTMIYAISPHYNGYDYTNNIYVKLYGFTNKEINFRIESNKALISYVHNDFRKIRTFSEKLTDCSKPFYYIGDYDVLVESGYLYQETLYGKINIYYKSKINSDDKSILINEDSQYLIEKKLFPLDTSIDIVELKCELPGYYQVHIIDIVDEREINLYTKMYNYLPSGKNFVIYPNLSPIQEDIYFEISTPEGKQIKINDGTETKTIDSNNKYYHAKYKQYSAVPQSFTVSSNEDTVISITLTNPEPFIVVDSEYVHVNPDSILVKLKQDKTYESANIIVTRIYHGFSYSIFKGNVDYAAKLIESDFDYYIADRSHKINITISNPYLKDDSNYDENNFYYVLFSIDDPEMIQKDVMVTYNAIKEYEKLEIGKSKIINSETEKYVLPFSSEKNSLNILYLSCADSLQQINIYDYNDIIESITNVETKQIYQHIKISKKYDFNEQIGINFKEKAKDIPLITGSLIGITDEEIKDEDINKYTELKLNITQNEKIIKWETLEGIKQYEVFILEENDTYASYLNNPCFLQSIKNEQNNTNGNYTKYFSVNNNSIIFDKEGNYYTTVSATVEGKVPLIYIYEPILYNSSLIPPPPSDNPDDNEDDDDDSKGTIIFLAIALPLVILVVLVLLIILIKAKKGSKDVNEQPQEPLVRDTTQSVE